ncbi:uncharacterized protein LOC131939520 [Physella acuta]|uniref:uncharacterized protein LOC131939520 n=1 Tax=Physella acuta TaxID=109671 RepID=UPI0027DDCFF4|nr:uncharacterized protein LOC131939520 [Physella acuta]XP_059153854.1 uncharacterized protein LOC131939520 [Physella acuta]XP_059153866.1 uncharacterized protein LOC131939520 [Physella acuta]XP_059153875.1 uncharacterized protein LOC131939520 [Physella acuta]XP_059153885.1 uncharacterized protein LOC131939520 [Physella acuta]XP_059153894.1 uncharacterized protein LOC131939520 [Physella acuta]
MGCATGKLTKPPVKKTPGQVSKPATSDTRHYYIDSASSEQGVHIYIFTQGQKPVQYQPIAQPVPARPVREEFINIDKESAVDVPTGPVTLHVPGGSMAPSRAPSAAPSPRASVAPSYGGSHVGSSVEPPRKGGGSHITEDDKSAASSPVSRVSVHTDSPQRSLVGKK